KQQLLETINRPNLIFRVLDHLYQRIFSLCQQVHNNQNKLKELLDELVKNYISVFKLFFKNGVTADQSEDGELFVQRVINTYLIDLVKLVLQYEPNVDQVEFYHYSNLDLSNRQVMSIIYND